ncbi:MAG: PqqD family protein [Coleofasciculaceae cyanobacterium]
MNQITSIFSKKLSIPDHILAQEVAGEVVLLDLETESYYSLNPVGSRYWHLLAKSGDVEAAVQEFLQLYTVDEEILRQDVKALISELVKEALLTEL